MSDTNITDDEIERRVVLMCAFNALHHDRAPLPDTVLDRHEQTAQKLVSFGFLSFIDGQYWINQAGLAHWWKVVYEHQTIYNTQKQTILEHYNQDGTRIQEG